MIENNFGGQEVSIEGTEASMGFGSYNSSTSGTADYLTWTHVVGVWNAGQAKVYVNGVLSSESTGSATEFVIDGASFKIGRDDEAAIQYLAGDVDDIRIYSSAVRLVATPTNGSTFAGWKPSPCAASFTMPKKSLTCIAIFESNTPPPTYTLKTTIGGTGTGTITGQ